MTKRLLINRRELAAEFEVHPKTITKWEREGLPVEEVGRKGRPSLYSLADCRRWRTAREVEVRKSAASGTVVDLTRERARKEHAQALVQEQTLAIRARDLIPRAEVEETWSKEVAAVRSKLLAWPATLSEQLHRAGELGGRLSGAREIEKILSSAVEELLHELSTPEAERPARRGRSTRKKATSSRKKKPATKKKGGRK